jgi:hypothetical protein
MGADEAAAVPCGKGLHDAEFVDDQELSFTAVVVNLGVRPKSAQLLDSYMVGW